MLRVLYTGTTRYENRATSPDSHRTYMLRAASREGDPAMYQIYGLYDRVTYLVYVLFHAGEGGFVINLGSQKRGHDTLVRT